MSPKLSYFRIGLRQIAFRVLSRPPSSLACRSRSFNTVTAFASRSRPLQIPVSHLQRRFASEEAQTQSEPAADRAEEGQHGDNSIAASAEEKSESTFESQPAEHEQPRTVGEFASSAAEKVKGNVSNALDAFAGAPGRRDSRRDRYPDTMRPEPEPSKTVYVGNLFFDVREDDIKQAFEKIGTVESIKIITDNLLLTTLPPILPILPSKPTGTKPHHPPSKAPQLTWSLSLISFGYVTFATIDEAASAIHSLHQTPFEGRRLTVQFSNNRATRSGNLETGPRFNRERPENPTRTLFVGNMSFEMSDRELNELFREIRNVVDVRVAIDRRTGQPRGFAHADFTDVESAKEAMVQLSGKEVCGRTLRVDYSQGSGRPPPRRVEDGTPEQSGF
ncbi:MAG: hypothetical protein Q9170_003620 [Blastenia crenularia]